LIKLSTKTTIPSEEAQHDRSLSCLKDLKSLFSLVYGQNIEKFDLIPKLDYSLSDRLPKE
jgi:hypothetical protein